MNARIILLVVVLVGMVMFVEVDTVLLRYVLVVLKVGDIILDY